jgi:hypothetical protein
VAAELDGQGATAGKKAHDVIPTAAMKAGGVGEE